MAALDFENLFHGVYKDKRVFVTGHSGFKGSWLVLWLKSMGAKVCGYSLAPDTDPNHTDLLKLDIESHYGDIRDRKKLNEVINNFKPDIVFHLAAQPLVRYSYQFPIETYETNVLGSLYLYEACKNCASVKAVVSITTDKVYENYEWERAYHEDDRFGGKDPYSSSKAAMEILTNSYRDSFLRSNDNPYSRILPLAVARAGNVIGGGDWAQDRLIPDIMKATMKGEATRIRNPDSTRPWQHVLEPLSGYLLLGQKLLENRMDFAEAYNFGPPMDEIYTVHQVTEYTKEIWPEIKYQIEKPKEKLHEANLLKLDCTKAEQKLSWQPVWNGKIALMKTMEWYKAYYQKSVLYSKIQLETYITDANMKGLCWINNA